MKAEPIVLLWQPDNTQASAFRNVGFRVETISSRRELTEKYDGTQPCCVICDLAELENFRTAVQGVEPEPAILVTSKQHSIAPIVQALRSGVVSVVEVPSPNGDIRGEIQAGLDRWTEVADGQGFRKMIGTLTPQERQVLDYILAGRSNKEVANLLNVSLRTVESRRHNIFAKTNTSTFAELVRRCTTSQI